MTKLAEQTIVHASSQLTSQTVKVVVVVIETVSVEIVITIVTVTIDAIVSVVTISAIEVIIATEDVALVAEVAVVVVVVSASLSKELEDSTNTIIGQQLLDASETVVPQQSAVDATSDSSLQAVQIISVLPAIRVEAIVQSSTKVTTIASEDVVTTTQVAIIVVVVSASLSEQAKDAGVTVVSNQFVQATNAKLAE